MTAKARSLVARFEDGSAALLTSVSVRERDRLIDAWQKSETRFVGLDKDGPVCLNLSKVVYVSVVSKAQDAHLLGLRDASENPGEGQPRPALTPEQIAAYMSGAPVGVG